MKSGQRDVTSVKNVQGAIGYHGGKVIGNLMTPKTNTRTEANVDSVVNESIYQDKKVDVLVENPIIREREVEVPFEVIIEKPVKNIIEKEVIVEINPNVNIIDKIVYKPCEIITNQDVNINLKKIDYVRDEKVEYITEKVTKEVAKYFEEKIVTEIRKVVNTRKDRLSYQPIENRLIELQNEVLRI